MKRNMRKKLLLGTVALMAGVGLASAQGMREGPGEPSKSGEHGLSSGSSGAKHESEIKSPARGKTETRGEGIVGIIARHNKIEMVRNSALANDSDACSDLGDILDSTASGRRAAKFNDSFS
jgi:hypothetical protein